jgi:hypothetical protein
MVLSPDWLCEAKVAAVPNHLDYDDVLVAEIGP